MFVHRTRGVVAATLGVLGLGLGACDDPTQNTDLRPEGPPEVLAVLVFTDAVDGVVETATYCKPNDEKRPSLVGTPLFTTEQVCPATLSETVPTVDSAYPDGWYVRIMFDELLNPEIETLTEVINEDTGEGTDTFVGSIATTQPVTLQCMGTAGAMVNVDYDGYYSPSGNRITWPLGPSLVIKPNDPTLVATNTECQVTINDNVTDKNGEAVPAGDRGPFKFKIAPIKAIFIDPPDDPEFDDPIDATQVYFDNFYIQFNTAVYAAGPNNTIYNGLCDDTNSPQDGLCDDESQISFKDVAHPDEGPGYCDDGAAGGSYTPCSTLADCPAGDTVCGRGYCDTTFAACNKASDCTDASDTFCEPSYTYSYAPFGLTPAEFGAGPVNPIEVEQQYIFSLTPNATLKDRCGKATMVGTPAAEDNNLVHFATNPFKYKTSNIATGETATMLKKLQLNFTNVIEAGDAPRTPVSTIDGATEISVTPAPFEGQPAVAIADPADLLIVSPDGNGQVMLRGFYEMGKQYTFTLKAGATINDFYGVTYTNPSDVTITWTTQPAIQITSVSPANNATVTKATPTSSTNITLTFNQAMVPASLEAADFTIEPPVAGLTLGKGTSATSATSVRDCTENVNTCRLRITGVFAPGDYKLTIKAGAQFTDVFGMTYTQAADRVVNFTVREAPATPACL